jgi:hypothetical protein
MKALVTLPLVLAVFAPASFALNDAVKTKSGESFTGQVVRMKEGKLVFDSQAAGEISVDWADVLELTTEAAEEVILKDGTRKRFRFGDPDTPAYEDIHRIRIETRPTWEARVHLGASRSFGNSQVTQVTVKSNALYRLQGKDRINADFTWLYSEEKDDATKTTRLVQRRTAGSLQYDKFFSDVLYGYARVSAEGDYQQDLTLRVMPGVGVGYQIFDMSETTWLVEAGLTWRYEDYRGMSPDDSMAARFATKYTRDLSATLDYIFEAEWTPSLEDASDHYAQMRNTLNADLGGDISASLIWEMDHDSTPAQGKDRNDHRIFLTLGIDL